MVTAVAALLLTCLLAACGGQVAAPDPRSGSANGPAGVPEEADGASPAAEPARPSGEAGDLTAAATQDRDAARVLRLDSHLFVEKDVAILTRRPGIVKTVRAGRGDRVREGQILCELESEDLRLARDVARIEADKARAALDRARRLHEEKAISDEEIENAEFKARSADHEADIATHELEKTFVRAPFDGVVSARSAEVGQVLALDDPRVLFRVTAMAPLLARVYAPQWAYEHVREGARVDVQAAGTSGAAVEGRVSWINDVLDPASGSAEVLVSVPRGPGDLRPGMAVTVEMSLRLPPGRLTLPREAVRDSPGSPAEGEVTVVAGLRREVRKVRLGFVGDDRVEIVSGLARGEVVDLSAGGRQPAISGRR